MQDFDFTHVAAKSVKGVFALVSRTFFLQFIAIVSFLILSGKLDESVFGIYIIAQSVIVFFNYFQDVGLAAALIQKREAPTSLEYRSVFTVQQALVLLLVIPAIIFSPQIASFYKLSMDGQILFIALVISFFLSSLRTIPTVMLERQLDFGKLVVPQILETLAFYFSLVGFVISGFEVTSFTIAVLAKSIVGLISTYVIMPWKIGLSFNFDVFKKLISFGIPFQVNNVLAILKDDLLFVYIGKILPFSEVGYIGFAQKFAFYPLRLIMDNVIRITFPSYSRLQHDPYALKIAIEKSMFLISFFIFPTAAGLISLFPVFLKLVPFYSQWQPAVLSLIFFSLNTVFSSISTPLTNFLNAIGKIKITLYFMIFWTCAIWILTPLFIYFYGFNGVAFTSFLVSLTSIGVFIIGRRYVAISFLKPVGRQFFAAFIMFIFIYYTSFIVTSLPLMLFEIVIASSLYLATMILLAKDELLSTIRFIMRSIKK